MRRVALIGAAALALVLCGGCQDQATPTAPSGPEQGATQFDQVESTLASIEADVSQP